MYQFFKLTLRSNVCGLLGFGCGQTPISEKERGANYKLQNPKIVIHTAHTQIAPKENEGNTEKIVL